MQVQAKGADGLCSSAGTPLPARSEVQGRLPEPDDTVVMVLIVRSPRPNAMRSSEGRAANTLAEGGSVSRIHGHSPEKHVVVVPLEQIDVWALCSIPRCSNRLAFQGVVRSPILEMLLQTIADH